MQMIFGFLALLAGNWQEAIFLGLFPYPSQ
jgi:hypothetical protein